MGYKDELTDGYYIPDVRDDHYEYYANSIKDLTVKYFTRGINHCDVAVNCNILPTEEYKFQSVEPLDKDKPPFIEDPPLIRPPKY
jgi:hypothetical protein